MEHKIYISLPITGCEETAKKDAEAFKEVLKKIYPGDEIKTPFDVCQETDKPYSYYISRDIEHILGVDAVVFMKNWKFSKGCQVEHHVAEICGKEILYQLAIENQLGL